MSRNPDYAAYDHLGDVRIDAAKARAAALTLAEHDALDLLEPLGLIGYEGHHLDVRMGVDRPAWREGSLR